MKALTALALVSGCYLRTFPLSATVVEDSTYEIKGDTYLGTAWVVDAHHLMTAGHVCDPFAGPYILISSTGRKTTGTPVQWELSDGDDTSAYADLCLVEAKGPLAAPLTIADRMPYVGEETSYVGYPLAHFTRSTGKYLGNNISSAPCNHGASGSAVYTAGGVVGVLVALRTEGGYVHDGSDGCEFIPLPDLKNFLRDAGIDGTPPPVYPPDYPVSPPIPSLD